MNNVNVLKSFSVLSISLLLACILMYLPLPFGLTVYHPDWILLLVLYWVMYRPDWVGLGFAWGVGLSLDAIQGEILGTQALTFLGVATLGLLFHSRLVHTPRWIQLNYIALILTSAYVVHSAMFWFTGQGPFFSMAWCVLLLDVLVWFGMVWGLDKIRLYDV